LISTRKKSLKNTKKILNTWDDGHFLSLV
jgi:hypothetical protein